MAQHMGACIYCGQTQMVTGGEDLTPEEIDKLATLQCNCDAAQALQKLEQKKTYAEANVRTLFENDGSAAVDLLLRAVTPLASKNIKKLSLVTTDGVKATLTAKENSIKVERTVTDHSALED